MFQFVIFLLIGASFCDKLSHGTGYSQSAFNGMTRDASVDQQGSFGSPFQLSFAQGSQDQEFDIGSIQNGFDAIEFGGSAANGFRQSSESGFDQDSAEFQRSQFLNGFRSTSQFYSAPSKQNSVSANGNGIQNGFTNGNGKQNGFSANGNVIQNGFTNGNGRQNGFSANGNGRQNGISTNGIGGQNGYSTNGNGRQNGFSGNGRPQFQSNGFGMIANGGLNGRTLNGNGELGSGASSYGSNGIDSEEPDCKNGKVMDPSGNCVEPEIIRNLYIYKQPKMEISGYEMPMELPKPKVKLNVVVINSASEETSEPIIIPPPQEKTLVLVLNKDDGEQKVIEIPDQPASQPEVFFVEYNEGDNPELPGGIDLETALLSSVSQNGESAENGNTYSAPAQEQPQNGYTQRENQFSSQNGNGEVNNQYLPPQAQQQRSYGPSSQYMSPSSTQPQNGIQRQKSYGGQREEQQARSYGGRQTEQSQFNGNGNGGSSQNHNGSYQQQQQASVVRAALSAFIPDHSTSGEGDQEQYGMQEPHSANGRNGYSGVPAPQAPAQRRSYFY